MKNESLQRRVLQYVLVIGLVFGPGGLFLPQSGYADAEGQFLGEIMCGGWNFCPDGWGECDGRVLQIAANEALFRLIGTIYGGDGQTTFALPNIVGRTMIHQGQGTDLSIRRIGETGGGTVSLSASQIPSHSHALNAQMGSANSASPTNNLAGTVPAADAHYSATKNTTLAASAIGTAGGGQPYNINLQPYLAVKCCIALSGITPSQN